MITHLPGETGRNVLSGISGEDVSLSGQIKSGCVRIGKLFLSKAVTETGGGITPQGIPAGESSGNTTTCPLTGEVTACNCGHVGDCNPFANGCECTGLIAAM